MSITPGGLRIRDAEESARTADLVRLKINDWTSMMALADAPASARRRMMKISILFATETGNAETLADDLRDELGKSP